MDVRSPEDREAKRWLDLAARAASRAIGHVEPNPLVGCAIVRDGRLLGLGHHRRFGDLHAERDALADCRRRGHDPRGATVYVTLEPCVHTGKQPPCTEALIDAGIARVVFARHDPGHESGGGGAVLAGQGVACELSCASEAAVALSDPFVHRVHTGRPWVIVKWAQTIDGRIATRTGESQWISSDRSRRRVHAMRGRVDAILTGLGTLNADNPRLTVRGARARRTPMRVLLDTDLEADLDRVLFDDVTSDRPVAVACSKDLITTDLASARRREFESRGVRLLGVPERPPGEGGGLRLDLLLSAMAERLGISTVLIEAGPRLVGAFFDADLVNEAVVYVAPLLFGDDRALGPAGGRVAPRLADGRRFELMRAKRIGDDVEMVYRRKMGEPGFTPTTPASDQENAATR